MAHFHVSRLTVSNLLSKTGVHGYLKDDPGSRRPHVTDANDDAYYIINEIQARTMLQKQLHTHIISRHDWDIVGRAVAEIDPAPAGLEDLMPHLQTYHKGKSKH